MKLSEIKAKNWSLSLTGYASVVEGLAEISQSVFIIITTRKGSDPLRPTFGSDIYEYIDRPINEAIPRMIKAAVEALEIWEPRVKVTRVGYNLDVDGLVEFSIEWTEQTTQATETTKILINGTN
jgi:phage baseplate assembly protein W